MSDDQRTIVMIDVGYACYWIELGDNGRVIKAPPIARWMIGKRVQTVLTWVHNKGGTVTGVPL